MLAAQPQLNDLRKKMNANHIAVAEADAANDDYDARVHALATESGQLATEMTLLRAQIKAGIQSHLTPSQQQELTDFMQQRRQKMHHRRSPAGNPQGDEIIE